MNAVRRSVNVYHVMTIGATRDHIKVAISHDPDATVCVDTASSLFGLDRPDDRMPLPNEVCLLIGKGDGTAICIAIADLLPVVHEYNKGL